MQSATHSRRRSTMGSTKELAERQRPGVLPGDLHAEWDLVTRAQPNVLLVGTSSATHEMLVAMTPCLRRPIHECRPTAGVPLPQPHTGTLVLLEVAGLDAKQQRQLVGWLNHLEEPLRVVSTTSAPLFSLVQAGTFLADLYYRLNCVRIYLIAPRERTP